MENYFPTEEEKVQDLHTDSFLEETEEMDEFVPEQNDISAELEEVNSKVASLQEDIDSYSSQDSGDSIRTKNNTLKKSISSEDTEPTAQVKSSKKISSKMTKKTQKAKKGTILNNTVTPVIVPTIGFVAKEAVSNNGKYNFPHHPLLKKFIGCNDAEKLSLYEDFKNNGIRHPVYTFGGKLINSRYKVECAKKLGLPLQIVEWEGDENELQSFMDSLHILDKDLTPTQRGFMAFENKDRFKKPKNLLDKKKELEGEKSKGGHDSNKFALMYYKSSSGMVAKVKKLDSLSGEKTLLYQYTRNGKISIDVAIYLAEIKVSDDKQLLDLISKHELNSSQARDLSLIKNDAALQDLFMKIKAATDNREVKRFIKFYRFIDSSEIFTALMSGSITISEAQAKIIKLNLEQAASEEVPSDTIDSKVLNRISTLAKKSNISVSKFLSKVIDKYEQSLKRSK